MSVDHMILYLSGSVISVTSELGKIADGSRGIPGKHSLGKQYACEVEEYQAGIYWGSNMHATL